MVHRNSMQRRWLDFLIPKSVAYRVERRLVRLNYDLPSNLEFRVARTRAELTQAFGLLHDTYVAAKFMRPNPLGIRLTKYHLLPSTATLIATIDDVVVGTVSLIRKSSFGLPIENIFDLSHFTSLGARVVEVSGLAIHPDYAKQKQDILFPLCKYISEYGSRFFGADYFAIAFHPHFRNFYYGALPFTPLDGGRKVKTYPFVNGAPALGGIVEAVNIGRLLEKNYAGTHLSRNLSKYFSQTEFKNLKFPHRQVAKISDPVMTPELMGHFFSEKSDIFQNLSRKEVFSLHQTYRDDRFKNVLPRFGNRAFSLRARKESRFDVATRGRMRGAGSVPFPVALRTVSRSGVGLFSSRALNERDVYHLEADLGSGRSARLDVKPAWSSRFSNEYGLCVLEASSDWRSYIEELNADMFDSDDGLDT